MKIQPYIEKLNASPEFAKFKKENPEAFLVAGFFVLDFESGQNLHQIDYYVPSEKKVAAFTIDDDVRLQMMNMMTDKVPEKLDIKTKVDLDALQGILEDEMKNRNITEDIKKIVAVIQTVEGSKTWILNCILSGMEILKAHVEDESSSVLMMEKASVMDYIKKIPGQALKQNQAKPSKEDINKQLEQLEKLKEVLKKQRDEVEKNKKAPPEVRSSEPK